MKRFFDILRPFNQYSSPECHSAAMEEWWRATISEYKTDVDASKNSCSAAN